MNIAPDVRYAKNVDLWTCASDCPYNKQPHFDIQTRVIALVIDPQKLCISQLLGNSYLINYFLTTSS